MINRYTDLIDQTFYFPQEGFELRKDQLCFHNIPIKRLIDIYGTPFRLTYLPKIGRQIRKARNLFNKSFKELSYSGQYYYSYCTKSNHFHYVLNEVLKEGVHIETSSSFDIDLVQSLRQKEQIHLNKIIINNGYKTDAYLKKIADLIDGDFKNVIPVLDNKTELPKLLDFVQKDAFNIGIRVATEEEPKFEFYTSRLGIRRAEILEYCKQEVATNKRLRLKMLHFFVDTGIKDTIYYWSELKRAIKLYCEIKKICPDLKAINIGGGMPIRHSLDFDYDYAYMIKQIVEQVKSACDEDGIPHPDIFTEFGKFTVAESEAMIYQVLSQKLQNDSELWYMINGSLMNDLPDTWGMGQRFILLPVNHWNKEYRRVNIGGITCDNADYYNSEAHNSQLYLPLVGSNEHGELNEPLYLGFFHTGAYQSALSGYGGIKHCLIPSPKHVLVDIDEDGQLKHWLRSEEQSPEQMLDVLGY